MTMSLSEQAKWQKFRERHGPLNPMFRNDVANAIVAAQMTRLHTGRQRVDLDPFLPFNKVEQDQHEDVFDSVARKMGAKSRG